MDFESPAVAQKAVTALKSKGIQAQMAKVFRALCPLNFLFLQLIIFYSRLNIFLKSL